MGFTKRILGTEYSKFSAETYKSDPNAKCVIKPGATEKRPDQWAGTAYLARKSIEYLEKGMQKGTTQKPYYGMP